MRRIHIIIVVLLLSLSADLQATVVRFHTSLGDIDVRLFDEATPQTVDNLLAYLVVDAYNDTIIHRSVDNFVIQGGGYYLNPDIFSPTHITTNLPVENEPGIANIRNTIAMAKLSGDPDSATSEWFFSVKHNTSNLDNQNEGFTVFGSVVNDTMSVVDTIESLATIDVVNGLQDVPVQDFDKVVEQQNVFNEDAVLITSISILMGGGDYNFDDVVDADDLAIWQEDYNRLEFLGGDFNDDLEMDGSDLMIWQGNYGILSSSVSYNHGDANGDFSVDGTDYMAWLRGQGSTVDAAADGDGSASVNGADFLLWQRTLGEVAAANTNIPEPSTLAQLLGGLLLFVRRSRG